MQLGVNHIGHFHLTTLMLPALHAAGRARVVSVSSTGHHWSGFDFDDPNFERTDYDPLTAYGRSKTANALFAVELDRRYRDAGIRAFRSEEHTSELQSLMRISYAVFCLK